MFVFLFFLTFLYLPFSNGDPPPLPMPMESDVYHTLFGNIGSMEDMFLKEDEATTPQPSRRHSAPADDHDDSLDDVDLDLPNLHEFDRGKLTEHSFDIIDFLTINEQHANFTKEYKKKMKNNPKRNLRRNLNRNPMRNDTMGNQTISLNSTTNSTRRRDEYQDPDDYWHSEYIERQKKAQLVMILAQFALHCRYEVGKALTQRDLVRNDKRYKIGYLFNRMRRLKTEQLKQIGASELQKAKKVDANSMMRSYERVVHFDVDMRDTANLIKRIMAVDERYDFVERGKRIHPPRVKKGFGSSNETMKKD